MKEIARRLNIDREAMWKKIREQRERFRRAERAKQRLLKQLAELRRRHEEP